METNRHDNPTSEHDNDDSGNSTESTKPNALDVILSEIDAYKSNSDPQTLKTILAATASLDTIDQAQVVKELSKPKLAKKHGMTKTEIKKAIAGTNRTWFRERRDAEDNGLEAKPIVRTHISEDVPKQIVDLSDEVFDRLVQANDPPTLFRKGKIWVKILDGDNSITPLHRDTFHYFLSSRFYCLDGTEKACRIPGDVAGMVENHDQRLNCVPEVSQVVNRPLIHPDGTIVINKGYDSITKNYLISDFELTEMSLQDAQETLIEPFRHFPFRDDSSRANAFAFLFTLLMRENLGTNVPIFHFGASRQGTGKGLLLRMLYAIAHGQEPKHATFKENDESLERAIASKLLAGNPLIFLDNVKDGWTVDSAAFEMFATAPEVTLRVLYQTEESEIRNFAVYSITGNNLRFDAGLHRRVQHCILQSDEERPDLPTGLPDLTKYIASHRNLMLSATVTIIGEWVKRGLAEADINLASYRRWSNVIAPILEIAGIHGFEPVNRDVPDDDLAYRLFIHAIWQRFGDENWGVAETLHLASVGTDENPGENLLGDILRGEPRKHGLALGYILKKLSGRVFDYPDDMTKLKVQRMPNKSPAKYFLEDLNSDVNQVHL